MDLLSALNTGHAGGCGTVHANRAEQLPARIEALCAGAGVARAAAHSLLLAAVDVVVHLVRDRSGGRRIAGIGLLVPADQGLARVVAAYEFAGGEVIPCAGAAGLADRLAGGR
jgi:pilus assembly protein CpaF